MFRKRNVSPSKQGTHQVAGGAMVNGLLTLPELPSIVMAPEAVAPFSMPQEVLTFVPSGDDIVTNFKNGVKERKLFCNIELTEGEQESLRKLQAEARSQNQAFLPEIASAAMRYLSRARGDPKKAMKEMLATQGWRQSYFKDGPLIAAAMADDFQHGIVYWTGRDKGLRPTLVIRPGRIPASWHKGDCAERLLRLLVFSLEYMLRYLTFPGKVETSTIIIDLNGCTLAQVPFSSLREIVTVLSVHYILRVHRFYICNVPTVIQRMSGMGLRMLSDKQQQKLRIVQNIQDFRQDFALHQLEEQYGGSRPPCTSFFPFSLQAGPFNAGCSMGANTEAVPNLHQAFKAASIQGRAWDPSLSREQNGELEYTEFAEKLFRQCGAPFPKKSVAHEGSKLDARTSEGNDAPVLLGSQRSRSGDLMRTASAKAALQISGCEVRKDDKWDMSPVMTSQGHDAPVALESQRSRSGDLLKTANAKDASNAVVDSLAVAAALTSNATVANGPDKENTSMDPVVDSEQVRPATGFFSCMVCRQH